jgi:hypothetical protein
LAAFLPPGLAKPAFVLDHCDQDAMKAAADGVVRSKYRVLSTFGSVPPSGCALMCTPSRIDVVGRSHSGSQAATAS